MVSSPSPGLVAAARTIGGSARRALLGITGAPGAGKTTLARQLVDLLNQDSADFAVHVPMDGFHLADVLLARRGTLDRKGAPETFDGWGYLDLLRRLRSAPEHPVFAPLFERTLEQPIAGGIEVAPATRLVVSEGNYLLLDEEPWSLLRAVFDQVWFCEADPDRRVRGLVERHVAFGKDLGRAAAWVEAVDEANARLVSTTRNRADRIVTTY